MDISEDVEQDTSSLTTRLAKKKELDSWYGTTSMRSSRPIDFDVAGALLFEWTRKREWAQNPKMYFILREIDREDLFPELLAAHITDFWIPLSTAVVKRFLEKPDRERFFDAQNLTLDDGLPRILAGHHFSFEDIESMGLEQRNQLGEGGFASVHHVHDPRTGKSYARKVMNKVRSGGFKKQCEAMKSFKKEVMGMRRVRHPHCVDLLASWTEAESVGLICSPVADMDLASYLDMDLSMLQLGVLRNSVGCITSALVYLHGLNIRYIVG
jgi:hypothetical protein